MPRGRLVVGLIAGFWVGFDYRLKFGSNKLIKVFASWKILLVDIVNFQQKPTNQPI